MMRSKSSTAEDETSQVEEGIKPMTAKSSIRSVGHKIVNPNKHTELSIQQELPNSTKGNSITLGRSEASQQYR